MLPTSETAELVKETILECCVALDESARRMLEHIEVFIGRAAELSHS